MPRSTSSVTREGCVSHHDREHTVLVIDDQNAALLRHRVNLSDQLPPLEKVCRYGCLVFVNGVAGFPRFQKLDLRRSDVADGGRVVQELPFDEHRVVALEFLEFSLSYLYPLQRVSSNLQFPGNASSAQMNRELDLLVMAIHLQEHW